MEADERQFVLDQLAASEADLLQLVEGLSPAQWAFRETPDRWSIAEVIEHLVVFEDFILGVITRSLAEQPQPEKKAHAPGKEHLVLGLVASRNTRFKAREAALPKGRWPDPVELIAEFRAARARTCAFAAETQANLRDHFFPHIVFGDLDCYQWLVVLGTHGSRHALQIREIMSHPAYPSAVMSDPQLPIA